MDGGYQTMQMKLPSAETVVWLDSSPPIALLDGLLEDYLLRDVGPDGGSWLIRAAERCLSATPEESIYPAIKLDAVSLHPILKNVLRCGKGLPCHQLSKGYDCKILKISHWPTNGTQCVS